jgi:hypothetical protein
LADPFCGLTGGPRRPRRGLGDNRFREQGSSVSPSATAGADVMASPMRSLIRELDRIELRAKSRRDDATDEMKRCAARLRARRLASFLRECAHYPAFAQ